MRALSSMRPILRHSLRKLEQLTQLSVTAWLSLSEVTEHSVVVEEVSYSQVSSWKHVRWKRCPQARRRQCPSLGHLIVSSHTWHVVAATGLVGK